MACFHSLKIIVFGKLSSCEICTNLKNVECRNGIANKHKNATLPLTRIFTFVTFHSGTFTPGQKKWAKPQMTNFGFSPFFFFLPRSVLLQCCYKVWRHVGLLAYSALHSEFLSLGHPTYWRVSSFHYDLCHTLHHHHGLCHQHSPPLLIHASWHGTLGPPCLPAQSSEAALHAQACGSLCHDRRESSSWRNSRTKLWEGLKTRQQPSAQLNSTQPSSSTGLYSIYHSACGKGEWSQRGKKNGSQWVSPSGE